MDKNKKFTPPPPPVPTEDTFFDLYLGDEPLASATEFTGMGRIMPADNVVDEEKI